MAGKSSTDQIASDFSSRQRKGTPLRAESPYLSPAVKVAANVSRYAQGALARVLEEAPYLARCSADKTATKIRPREHALRYPYMQVNRRDMVSWLVFDLDHQDSGLWLDEGLPAPNIIVRNPDNGHAHLFYAIPPVCTSNNAHSKPIQFMRSVYRAMAVRLQADAAYSGPVAKTPGHPWWQTIEIHNQVISLCELADYFDEKELAQFRYSSGETANAHSRHCLLFEATRHYAYGIVNDERATGSYKQFYRRVDAYAHQQNNFRSRGFFANLSIAQIKATVKSVVRWTWDNYKGRGGRFRGRLQLDPALPLSERQRRGAVHTHAARKETTIRKIERACQALTRRGDTLSQRAVARLAGVARQTVAKYREILDRAESAPTAAIRHTPLPTEAASATVENGNVNYGVHQITAPQSGALKNEADLRGDGLEELKPAPS
jgi:hypothetical protein